MAAATAAAFATEAAKSKLCLCALALLSKLTSSLRWWLPKAAFFSLSKVMRSKVGGCWGSRARLGGSGSLGYSCAAFLILRSTAWSVSSGLMWLLLSKVGMMAFLGEDKSTGSCCTVVLVMFYMSELFDSLVRTEAAMVLPLRSQQTSRMLRVDLRSKRSRTLHIGSPAHLVVWYSIVHTVVKKKTNLTHCCLAAWFKDPLRSEFFPSLILLAYRHSHSLKRDKCQNANSREFTTTHCAHRKNGDREVCRVEWPS